MKKYIPILLVCSLVLLLCLDVDAQCAMCKKVADGKDPNSYTSVAKNLNSAILYLMAVPYFALMFIFRHQIVSVIRNMRKKNNL
ncbi:MAG: hypothetical protein IT233_02740 [Bacteroidia bacterium]|nr:hypothetical protein [Bacteroidia bacterium]